MNLYEQITTVQPTSMDFVLPWPPSVNHYWRHTFVKKHNRIMAFLTEDAKRFRIDVQAFILERYGLLKPTTERVSLAVTFHAPDRRRYDLDNFLKGVLDALKHARVYVDDSQVDELHVARGEPRSGGKVEVVMRELL